MKINLCVGPMSMNTINSINYFAKNRKKEITIICSRNQIESNNLGGGYVNNFTTEKFSQYIKNFNNKFIKIARDHGGPYTSDKKKNNFRKEMNNSKNSLEQDIKSGFNEIHIDTSNVKDKKFELAIDLYKFCNEISNKYNKKISYEIGINFHGDYFNKNEFLKLFNLFKKYKNIKYFTGTTGSKIKNSKQVGKFNSKDMKFLSSYLYKNNILIKDHNCDFLELTDIKFRKKIGITSFNIGPELAYNENKILYKYGNTHKNINFIKFFKKVLNKNKWKKWCDNRCSDVNKFLSSAHYFYNDSDYKIYQEKYLNNTSFKDDVLKEHIKIYEKFF